MTTAQRIKIYLIVVMANTMHNADEGWKAFNSIFTVIGTVLLRLLVAALIPLHALPIAKSIRPEDLTNEEVNQGFRNMGKQFLTQTPFLLTLALAIYFVVTQVKIKVITH